METDTSVAAPEPVVTPPLVSDEGSLADHEAQFGANGTGPAEPTEPAAAESTAADVTAADPGERDAQGRFSKHRAKSQQATPADSPRIAELTKKWREAERRAEEAERRASARIPDTDRRAETPAAPKIETPVGDKFTFLSYDAYLAQHPDTDYEAWQDAKLDARDAWRDQQRATQTAAQERETAGRQIVEGYAAKKAEFAKTHPDFETVIAASAVTGMTPVLEQALLRHDKSPELVYYLAQHPDFYDEMLLLTADKPADEHFVALAQRRLSSRLQAAPTGSAVTLRPPSPAPRPPNPVRTGPMNTGDDPPGDDSSLADHERHYGPKRR